MSQLKVNSISDAAGSNGNAISLASDGTCTAKITNNLSNRNLIINGAGLVNQRSATGQPVSGYAYGVDRLRGFNNGSARYDLTQATVTDLAGFSKAYKLEVTTAQSTYSGTTISVGVETVLEGQDIAHLNFGTSNAKNIIVSFYVKSSVTGNFACAVFNGNSIDRVNVKDFTISSANTWERKSVTFVGDTGGTWKTDNTQGLYVALASAGSDSDSAITTPGTWQGGGYKNRTTSSANIFATNGATMQFTGLQLEIDNGSGVATEFEMRSYADELKSCERYYQTTNTYGTYNQNVGLGIAAGTNNIQFGIGFKTEMRTQPTVILYNGVTGDANKVRSKGGTNTTLNSVGYGRSPHGIDYTVSTSGDVVIGDWYQCVYTASAEL